MRQELCPPNVCWDLCEDDLAALRASFNVTLNFDRGDLLSPKGGDPFVGLLLAGYVSRRRLFASGGQQLFPVAIPGDFYGALDLAGDPVDFDIVALSRGKIATATFSAIRHLRSERSAIDRAWTRAMRFEEAILRECVVNLGGRTALSRLAHLFCEFATRSGSAALASGEAVTFPFTQSDLADSCGLSSIHVNRVLKELRARKLVQTRFGRLLIVDFGALARLGEFDPQYLRVSSIKDIDRNKSIDWVSRPKALNRSGAPT